MSKENMHDIFMTLRRKLARAVSRIVPPREIEDIVQETYVRVCEVHPTEPIRHPRSFLFKVACNLALDHVRRKETRLAVSLESEDELELAVYDAADRGDETYDQVAAKQEFELFCEAVRQLPVQCRRVFVLRKVYGYSQREIAQDLGISENTVEKHIAYGIQRCGYFMALRSPGADAPIARASRKKGGNRE